MASSSEFKRLLRSPRFARYYATVAAARATGIMFNVAGVLLVLQRTHDLALAGVVVAAAALPAAVSGPLLGGWLDVTAHRRRLLLLDRLVTTAALSAFLLAAGHAPNWLLPLLAACYGVTTPLSAGGFASVLPEVAGPELLGIANAFEGASVNVAFVVGPALAGVISGTAGPGLAIEVQIVAGVLLAALIARDDTFELRPVHDEAPHEGVMHAVRDGLRASWRIAQLRWNTAIDCFYVLAWSTLNVSFPAYAVALGAGAHASGYMWAVVAAGSLAGGFLLRLTASDGRALWRGMGRYLLLMALSAALWPVAGSLAVALALIFLTGLLDGPALVGLVSIRQQLAPPHLRAQIFTTANSVHNACTAAGAAAAGLIFRVAGTDATLLAFAALIAATGIVSLLVAVRLPHAEAPERLHPEQPEATISRP